MDYGLSLGGAGFRCPQLAGLLQSSGWVIEEIDEVAGVRRCFQHCPDQPPALAWLDGRIDGDARHEWIAALRALPGLWGGTPLLLTGPGTGPLPPGVSGRIAATEDAAEVRRAIEEWTGPLSDAGLRASGDPLYRLTRLMGGSRARAILRRFADALAHAEVEAVNNTLSRDEAHRMAGLAGMLGFEEIGRAWQEVERKGLRESARAIELGRVARARMLMRGQAE